MEHIYESQLRARPSKRLRDYSVDAQIIVLFKKGTAADVVEAAVQKIMSHGENLSISLIHTQLSQLGGSIGHCYLTTMTGFAATVPDSVLSALTDDGHIESVEADGEVSVLFKRKGN
ncbi:hypothetical protein HDU77_008225 [Chytriomyces hyalinus]|nr:hypothetical protein HDU77_008225 [Chytriomyces hyalinus]